MSNLKIIELLCALVEEQAKVIRHLSMELAHARNLTEAETKMVKHSLDQYARILGADEAPDL